MEQIEEILQRERIRAKGRLVALQLYAEWNQYRARKFFEVIVVLSLAAHSVYLALNTIILGSIQIKQLFKLLKHLIIPTAKN